MAFLHLYFFTLFLFISLSILYQNSRTANNCCSFLRSGPVIGDERAVVLVRFPSVTDAQILKGLSDHTRLGFVRLVHTGHTPDRIPASRWSKKAQVYCLKQISTLCQLYLAHFSVGLSNSFSLR